MKYKYGLLKYSTGNIGDEIQSIATRQFLPRVDLYLDRDYLRNVRSKQRIKLIMNGWFTSRPKNWPPSSDIEPLFVSFHISEIARKDLTSARSIEYFKQHEPIGCRDYFTRDLLQQKGVEAYFSGCLTLTLKSDAGHRTDEIILTDLDEEAMQNIPPDLLNRVLVLSHRVGGGAVKRFGRLVVSKRLYKLSPSIYKMDKESKLRLTLGKLVQFKRMRGGQKRAMDQFQQAQQILNKYARAKLVITSRFHCALPCLAFATPVIFVRRDLEDVRFKGLLQYIRSYSVEEFNNKVNQIDLDNPEPNPGTIDCLRESLIRTCQKFITDG